MSIEAMYGSPAAGSATDVPEAWYNVLADLDIKLPPDLAARTSSASLAASVPLALVRQEISRRRFLPIPSEVQERYRQWRPTLLCRARRFEQALGTHAHIYYKYEGANVSGSHKLNTAVAQAFYYRNAGAGALTTATGAGQWGTALAAACAMFGLRCQVHMVRASLKTKPYRASIMRLLGATVMSSPSSPDVTVQRSGFGGSLSIALAEAIAASRRDASTHFCAGSGETYSLLHQTVIGLEARDQLERAGVGPPDVVVASVGGGSNFGGLALPFLGLEQRPIRFLCVEPAACPTLTRGRYAYDFTDASGQTPLQKMYTLGHGFVPAEIHAGGLRYHGASKLLSLLYHRGTIEAVAYHQRAVFESAVRFAQVEGILPAPESAHAIHGAVVEARRADLKGEVKKILVGVSGHGLLDMTAYQAFLDGKMRDADVSDQQIAGSLARLPSVSDPIQPLT